MKTKIPCGGFYLDDSLMLTEDNSLAVAETHDSLTVKFMPNVAPNAKRDEYLCDTPFNTILEAFANGIPVNGFVVKDVSTVYHVSLCRADFEDFECQFSSPVDIFIDSKPTMGFYILTPTSRIFGGERIYKMRKVTIDVGGTGPT